MSFRKFFFSTTAMSMLLLPGITVSASAYSLSDRYTIYQNSSDDDCEYYDDCAESENDYVEEEWYLSDSSSDEYSEDGNCEYEYDDECPTEDSPSTDGWAI